MDELNLAPSDVLEALNRLLDDNRELYVPELDEVVRPHEDFMLFATQNPSGLYGGRKGLSRAFRNRFVEISVDDIPESELPTIPEKSCLVAASQAKRMVQVGTLFSLSPLPSTLSPLLFPPTNPPTHPQTHFPIAEQ